MSEAVVIDTEPRDQFGSRSADKLRKKGRLPAVIYGHKEAAVSVTVSAEDFEKAVRAGVRVFDLRANGTVQTAQLKEIQYDFLGKDIIHADFKRVDKDEKIVTAVPIELRGVAPGTTGGVLDQPLHQVHLRCPVLDVPRSIRVNIEKLQLGQAIHVHELALPAGVEATDDPELVVVQVKAAVDESLPTEQVEPEVIGRQREEAAEEEKG